MKRSILRIVLSVIFILSVFVFAFGCGGKGEPTVSGGESSLVTKYQWNGLRDFALKISDKDYSFDEVTVTDADGLFYDVSVDDSNVVYGTKGEYAVKFTAKNETKSAKVIVYDLPAIIVPQKTDYSYEEIIDRSNPDGIFELTSASDCFGNDLIVSVEDNLGMSLFNEDGSVEYGSHDINLVAVDAAGQIAKASMTIDIARDEQTEPQILDSSIVVDVTDEAKNINISLKDRELIGIIVNGEMLTEDLFVAESSSGITIDFSVLETLSVGQSYTLKVITSGGYTQTQFSIVDEKPAQMDISGREEQTAFVGQSVEFVQPRRLQPKQNYNIVYSLTTPSGQSEQIDSMTFVANETGVYTLTATAKSGETTRGEVQVKYNVHYVYNDFSDAEKREGCFGYSIVYYTDKIEVVNPLAYEENTVLGDRSGNFAFVQFYGSSYLGFKFTSQYEKTDLTQMKEKGINNIFTYVYCATVNPKSVRSSLIKVGSLDDGNMSPDEYAGSVVELKAKTWTKLTVSLDDLINNYDDIKDGKMLFFCIYNGNDGIDIFEDNVRIYFTPILFDLPVQP